MGKLSPRLVYSLKLDLLDEILTYQLDGEYSTRFGLDAVQIENAHQMQNDYLSALRWLEEATASPKTDDPESGK